MTVVQIWPAKGQINKNSKDCKIVTIIWRTNWPICLILCIRVYSYRMKICVIGGFQPSYWYIISLVFHYLPTDFYSMKVWNMHTVMSLVIHIFDDLSEDAFWAVIRHKTCLAEQFYSLCTCFLSGLKWPIHVCSRRRKCIAFTFAGTLWKLLYY